MCVQVSKLLERCVAQLTRHLTLEALADIAVLADRVSHQRLHWACVDFALQEENMYDHGMPVSSLALIVHR